jgi:hypothetical protein
MAEIIPVSWPASILDSSTRSLPAVEILVVFDDGDWLGQPDNEPLSSTRHIPNDSSMCVKLDGRCIRKA